MDWTAQDGFSLASAVLKTTDAVRDGEPLNAAPALLGLSKFLPIHSVVKVVPMYYRDSNLGAFPPVWLTRGISKLQSNANRVVAAVDKAKPYVQPPTMQGVNPPAPPPAYVPPPKPAIPAWAVYGGVAVGAYFLIKLMRRAS